MLKCLVVMCLTNVGTEEQKAGKVSEWYKKNSWRNILQLITLTCNRSVTGLDIKK